LILDRASPRKRQEIARRLLTARSASCRHRARSSMVVGWIVPVLIGAHRGTREL
jgi:hypothetical protein